MQRKNVILLTAPTIECWGNFKKLCDAKGLPYHSLKGLKFPIIYKDFVIHRVEFK